MTMDKIPNSQLIADDIPSRRAHWKKVLPFAMTFNGYTHWGSFKKCREVADHGVKRFRGEKELNQSLTDLRTCLFFEARRWRHYEKDPSKKGMLYIHALVEAIRLRVVAKEIG
jgi:hypothetical protein